MGYVMGGVLVALGVTLARRGGLPRRCAGWAIGVLGLAMVGLSVMVDAKKNGVI